MEKKLETIRTWMALADEKIIVAQKLFDLSYFDDATSIAHGFSRMNTDLYQEIFKESVQIRALRSP